MEPELPAGTLVAQVSAGMVMAVGAVLVVRLILYGVAWLMAVAQRVFAGLAV